MTTVNELFAHVGVVNRSVVRWGEPPNEAEPGVYIVSTAEDAESNTGLSAVPLNPGAIEELLRLRPEATVDGHPATVTMLKLRLSAMWAKGVQCGPKERPWHTSDSRERVCACAFGSSTERGSALERLMLAGG